MQQYLFEDWPAAVREAGTVLENLSLASRAVADMGSCLIEAGVTRTATRITWLTCDAPGASGLRLAISAQGDYPFREAFAIQSGDPEFDQVFSIKTNDGPFARVWLDKVVRRHIAACTDYHFLIENGRVRAWRFAKESDAETLAAAMVAVTVLSQRGRALRREWALLASLVGGKLAGAGPRWRADGVLSLRVSTAGTEVTVDGFFGALGRRRPGRGLFTRVRCPRVPQCPRSPKEPREAPAPAGQHPDEYVLHDADGRRALRPRLSASLRPLPGPPAELAGRYRIECEVPDMLAARLDEHRCQLIAQAGPEVIAADRSQLTVFFLGVDVGPERLRAGIELATALAVERPLDMPGDPYR